jgi:predicted nucleic acid-binding protein
MAVVDASVYVALVNAHEPDHDRCLAWFEDAARSGEPILAPVVLLAEVSAALSRGVGSPALAHRVVRQMLRSPSIELVSVTVELAERAAGIAADRRIRGGDALYVALAELAGDELVTLDRQQLERGRAVVVTRRPYE